jgi:hypothetical protein
MTSAFKTWLLSAAILATPTMASATGGLGCSIDDKNLTFVYEALFSYSDIGGLFQIRGEMEAKDRRTYKTLQKLTLDGSELKQQWTRDKDVKLMIYRETGGDGVPFASVKLIIEATQPPDEDFAYSGKYQLTVQPAAEGAGGEGGGEAFTVEGKVECSAG